MAEYRSIPPNYADLRDYFSSYLIFISNGGIWILPPSEPTHPKERQMNEARTPAYAALVLRVALGAMFVAHALLKYYVFTLPGTVQFFQSLGLPGPLAYLTFWAELVGGALILLGLGTRYASLALMPILLGAAWAHAGNGWVFSAPNGGWEYPVFLLAASGAAALLGDGAYALRNLFNRHPQGALA
jgi:putative oxidoreductase